jgi:hypothetical protein
VDPLTQAFEERIEEIETYLDLLENLEKQVQQGPPRLGTGGPVITPQQQKILYSSVFIQLYNLVEATITWCLDAVSAATAENGRWQPRDLCANLRREWVRFVARTHVDLNFEHRLTDAVKLCEHLVQMLPVTEWEVAKGGGGSWDDNGIEALGARLGFSLSISPSVKTRVKRHFRDEKGALEFIKTFRNRLAHGNVSFVEGGENLTFEDLRELKEGTVLYLREVVACFRSYIDGYEFLQPDRRPAGTGGSTAP